MNYSFRFSNETNKNRLGRARNSFGLARPPTTILLYLIEKNIMFASKKCISKKSGSTADTASAILLYYYITILLYYYTTIPLY